MYPGAYRMYPVDRSVPRGSAGQAATVQGIAVSHRWRVFDRLQTPTPVEQSRRRGLRFGWVCYHGSWWL